MVCRGRCKGVCVVCKCNTNCVVACVCLYVCTRVQVCIYYHLYLMPSRQVCIPQTAFHHPVYPPTSQCIPTPSLRLTAHLSLPCILAKLLSASSMTSRGIRLSGSSIYSKKIRFTTIKCKSFFEIISQNTFIHSNIV